MSSPLHDTAAAAPGAGGPPAVTADEIACLGQLMATLNEHSATMERAYRALEERAAALNLELERKNEALRAKIEDLDRVGAHLNRVLDGMSEGIVTMSEEGVLTSANRAAGVIWGRSPAALRGLVLQALFAPPALETLCGALRERRRLQDLELPALAADGAPVPVRVSLAPLEGQGAEAAGSREWMLQVADLREVRALEEQARRADRLRALGELAAGVAHELRNPLTTIRGYVQLLPDEHGDAAFVAEMSRLVLGEIDRLAALTDSLLHLARPVGAVKDLVDVGNWAEEAAAFERERLALRGVRLAVRIDRQAALWALIDGARMRQVLLNLLQNAAEAMPQGGEAVLRVHSEGPAERRWVVLAVQDAGVGIAADQLEQIFDPFYTTKPHGSGLGLSIAHRIVEEHGGHMRVASVPGRGTTAAVWLPAAGGAP